MRFGCPRRYSEGERGQRGFTLLELTIAMTFVALVATGIAVSISTCLKVWRSSLEAAELSQEARAVMQMLSRDIRGAHVGLARDAGYFWGTPAEETGTSIDTLELCTESSAPSRLALLPEEVRGEWDQAARPPLSDYVGVRYEERAVEGDEPAGLYRIAYVVPGADPDLPEELGLEPTSTELVSTTVVALSFQYLDGEEWTESWETNLEDTRLPRAVAIELTLRDERERDHAYQTIVPVAAR